MKATFGALGASIWESVRENDRVWERILRYFSERNADKAESVMRLKLVEDFHDDSMDDFIRGAYHCLCGLGYLEPYIDGEGVECARLTEKGREVLKGREGGE